MFNETWYPEDHIGSSSILFRYTVDLGQVNMGVSYRKEVGTLSDNRRSCASFIEAFGMKVLSGDKHYMITVKDKMTNPIGVNVSKPFAADHGNPALRTLSCKFRAVISTANAIDRR